ncbi:hypothetical protein PP259_gp19 [Streptococcus phage SWK3]|uniref:CD1375-like domain-containing protein n=9 Tax=Aliceevansviridae TaxID=3044455 RepID=A0A3S7W921_9CAUD|nr:hypothetical protein PP257_gp19 [Streptococcus phage SW8]YP_010648155.1 hypothetical protein PP259_gp19 [Streptococcus phage SWK3]AYP29270.1 hypothetical protein SW21_019 [Streptococcus phage SW21]AYP29309.1 hypothetical protein SW8_019 [Streptococcus phage SW8]AYP30176.1 hypothetical protein SWK3_019 [Streptococcus phage SWK3]
MKTWLNCLSLTLKKIKEEIEREKDMIVKLFAINIVDGSYPFKRVPKVLKPKVKEQIAKMVEDDELLAQLTKE